MQTRFESSCKKGRKRTQRLHFDRFEEVLCTDGKFRGIAASGTDPCPADVNEIIKVIMVVKFGLTSGSHCIADDLKNP